MSDSLFSRYNEDFSAVLATLSDLVGINTGKRPVILPREVKGYGDLVKFQGEVQDLIEKQGKLTENRQKTEYRMALESSIRRKSTKMTDLERLKSENTRKIRKNWKNEKLNTNERFRSKNEPKTNK